MIRNLARADSHPAWCPGCGNFAILKALDEAIAESGIDPDKLVLVSGIGQAAKTPHYPRTAANVFNGLHGRALPAATGMKLANRELEVVITSGDGDMYGEGGNHFIHAVRRNIGVKVFVHNNQVYGLTKGQASPTSDMGFATPVQTTGVISQPFNPLALAVVEGAGFVARSFAGDREHLKQMMVAAMTHREGLALLDILQPCVTFNKVNTYKWYRQRVRAIDGNHDPYDREAALSLALMWGNEIPIGVIYKSGRASFESQLPVLSTRPIAAASNQQDAPQELG